MSDHLLTIDVGTQSVRAILFDAHGKLLAKAQEVIEPYKAPQPGWAEQDPEVYWEAIARSCRRLWETENADSVCALAVTTLRATTVCCDEDGRPLRPAMVWLDQRRCEQPPALPVWLRLALGAVGARSLVAQFQAQSEANWLAQHEPELWKATRRFVLLSGWLTHRMTGEWADSTGSQVGYLPFDYKRQQWAAASDWKWKALAVRSEQLYRLAPPGQPFGQLNANASDILGLRRGLPVIAAAADKACEVLGCGLRGDNEASLSFGTTATINTLQPRYVEVERMLPAYPAAVPQRWNTEIQIYRGFWMVSWFKREFAHREALLAAERGVPVESLFDALLDSVPAGSLGLMLQPYWSPGTRNPGPEAKGAIVGFGDVHKRAHVYRAMIEGLIYGLRAGKETIERRLHRKITRVVAAGGGSQSDAAMQIAADVFGQAVERPRYYETSALGAAINAAVGMGFYADHAAAVDAMCAQGRIFEPNRDASAIYDALYKEVYSDLYPRLRPLYRRIRRITGYPG